MKALLLAVGAAVVGATVGSAVSIWRFGLPSSGDPFDIESLKPAEAETAAPDLLSGLWPRVVVTRKDPPSKEAAVEADPEKQRVFDFGVLPQMSTGHVTFLFRNDGEGPLELKKGKTTCQCTLSALEATHVAPGSETTVTLTWKTEAPEGPYRHTADISTNDPAQPEVHLVVTGKVTRPVGVVPHTVSFGRVNASESHGREFTILAFHSPDFKLQELALVGTTDETPASTDPLASHAEFAFKPLSAEELKAADADAKVGYRAHVSLKPGLPLGRFERRIRLTTSLSTPTYANMIGLVVGDITIAGGGDWLPGLELFNLGESDADGVSKPLFLIVGGAAHRDVKVKVKQTLPPALQAKIGSPEKGNGVLRWPVTISIPPGTPAMSHADKGEYGKVILETTHPDYKELVISVSFLVIKPRP